MKSAHALVIAFLGVKKLKVAALKFFVLDRFVGKRFYHPDAGQAILQAGVDLSLIHI